MELPKKKYNIIYADPPWSYHTYKGKDSGNGLALKHYETMSNKDIENLRIQTIAKDDCLLFLWVTFPHLQSGLDVINAWGFKYKTVAFTWVKKYKNDNWVNNIGFYTRSNAEICLLGTKGRPHKFIINRNVIQVVDTYWDRIHSKKPNEVRKRIVDLVGNDLPKIELFAREKKQDWDSWGLEVDT
tara:strand:+ start:290 stop:844 length:555 start_codon:yes stop_codon:yes gene_type:complete